VGRLKWIPSRGQMPGMCCLAGCVSLIADAACHDGIVVVTRLVLISKTNL